MPADKRLSVELSEDEWDCLRFVAGYGAGALAVAVARGYTGVSRATQMRVEATCDAFTQSLVCAKRRDTRSRPAADADEPSSWRLHRLDAEHKQN